MKTIPRKEMNKVDTKFIKLNKMEEKKYRMYLDAFIDYMYKQKAQYNAFIFTLVGNNGTLSINNTHVFIIELTHMNCTSINESKVLIKDMEKYNIFKDQEDVNNKLTEIIELLVKKSIKQGNMIVCDKEYIDKVISLWKDDRKKKFISDIQRSTNTATQTSVVGLDKEDKYKDNAKNAKQYLSCKDTEIENNKLKLSENAIQRMINNQRFLALQAVNKYNDCSMVSVLNLHDKSMYFYNVYQSYNNNYSDINFNVTKKDNNKVIIELKNGTYREEIIKTKNNNNVFENKTVLQYLDKENIYLPYAKVFTDLQNMNIPVTVNIYDNQINNKVIMKYKYLRINDITSKYNYNKKFFLFSVIKYITGNEEYNKMAYNYRLNEHKESVIDNIQLFTKNNIKTIMVTPSVFDDKCLNTLPLLKAIKFK